MTRSARSKPDRTWSRACSPTAMSDRCDRSSMAPLPMNVAATGHVEAARQVAELGRGAPAQDPVAGEDDRPVRGRDQARRVVDRLVGRFGEVGATGGQRHGQRTAVGRRQRRRGEVLRQLDVGRAGLRQGRDAERLADDLGDGLDLLHAPVPLRHRFQHPHDVDDLVRLLVQLVGRRLPGDRHHRRPIEVGVGDTGDEVRRPRPEGAHRDRRPTGEAPVDVRHEGGALLVAGRDVADGFVPRQRIEDVHRLLAGDREDELAAFGRETVDEQVGGAPRRSRGGGHVRTSLRQHDVPRPAAAVTHRRAAPSGGPRRDGARSCATLRPQAERRPACDQA